MLKTCDLNHADIIPLNELHNTYHWDVELERPVSRASNLPGSALCQVMQDRGFAREGFGHRFLFLLPIELAPTARPAFERHAQH
ncbi:hypothetical protein [Deinococcus sp. QL22]|uniref:hypothetical protein n=1 Tax=Deinococcus sp. QL22 TaxID=2939437 RepID=UPI002017DE53|nr:hypothetical protein [Deinococcus sp. QL22]UQN09050.1 hypothetical protein M1R55_23630 [Deinococcus sp. QL22]